MRKHTRISALLLSLVLMIGALPTAAQDADAGFDGFRKSASYSDGTFFDVGSGDWFLENVRAAYEYGLMIGKGEGRFDPSGNVKLSETVAIAARLHSLYHTGSADFVQGEPWYAVYEDYCRASLIVDSDARTAAGLPVYNPDAPASRRIVARILAAALPEEAWEAIRTVPDGAIPDVPMDDPDADAIYRLYRAGVLIGNDGEGTFSPENPIRRSEVAAIVTRMAVPALRKADESAGQASDSLLLTAAGHPELDFGKWAHDGEPMIRDYAVTPQDTVLILQMTGVVCEYDFTGKLLGAYDFRLEEQGLTAFRVCGGQEDEIYLLDGHNNAVLTCTRKDAAVTKVSPVRWNDLALSNGLFCCDSEGRLLLSAVDPLETTPGNIGVSYTYALDLTGKDAAVAEKMNGIALSDRFTFQVDKKDSTLASDEIYAFLYRDGTKYGTFTVNSLRNDPQTLIGMPVLGITEGAFLLRVIEILEEISDGKISYSTQETYLLVNPETGESRLCESAVSDASLIRYRDGEAYFLTRGEDSVTVQPLSNAVHPTNGTPEEASLRVTFESEK